jgi:hypothetical protein
MQAQMETSLTKTNAIFSSEVKNHDDATMKMFNGRYGRNSMVS